MPKPVLSIVTTVTDGSESIYFYLVLKNEVVGSCRIAYPRERMPVLMAGYVVEEHRKKGYWNKLFLARIKWLKNNNPDAEYVYLYVAPRNSMRIVYLGIGFEYTGEVHELNGCKWMRLKLG